MFFLGTLGQVAQQASHLDRGHHLLFSFLPTPRPHSGASFLYSGLQRHLYKAGFLFCTPQIQVLQGFLLSKGKKAGPACVHASPGHLLTPSIPSAARAPAQKQMLHFSCVPGTSPSQAFAHARSQPTGPPRHLCLFYTFQGSARTDLLREVRAEYVRVT